MRLLAVVAVCAGCSTYAEHRAAFVPRSTPIQTLGQPAAWRGTASLGASNAADLGTHRVGDPDAGVAVPGKQVRGALELAITRNLTMGLSFERGLASSAQPIKSTLPPLDNDPVVGVGYTASYSIDTGSPWRIGLGLELMAWSVPWVEYSACIDNCGDQPIVTKEAGASSVAQIGFGIVPSYQHGDWTLFGGVTGRTHPTIEEKITTNVRLPPEVEDGPLNAIVHAGAAYEAGERVRFVVDVHQTVTADPVRYMPGIGFSVVLGLGDRFRKTPLPPPVLMIPAAPGAAQPAPVP